MISSWVSILGLVSNHRSQHRPLTLEHHDQAPCVEEPCDPEAQFLHVERLREQIGRTGFERLPALDARKFGSQHQDRYERISRNLATKGLHQLKTARLRGSEI